VIETVARPRRSETTLAWMPACVVARQNLPLIVSDAHPNAKLGVPSLWGATLGNAVRVWRSGIGVDARGNLISLAAPEQTAASLARALIK